MDDSKLLFYDIEVFKYDSLIVFKNIQNQEEGHFWTEGEIGYSPSVQDRIKELLKDRILVGYNNHWYDDKILTTMLRPKHNGSKGSIQSIIKMTNDAVIKGENINFSFCKEVKQSLDCIQQIDVSRPGLKKIEGNLGKSVLESEISFDIDRPLTDDEKEIILNYCSYDVENTIEVYKLRKKSYFDVREELLKMIPNSDGLIRVNTTTLSAKILLGNDKLENWNAIKRREMLSGVPVEVMEMWEKASKGEKVKPIAIDEFGCSVTFGLGGLHGVAKNQKKFTNVKLLDVGSMYPTIITILEALGSKGTKVYDNLRQERLRIKHTDPVRAGALKLVLNSVYGNLKNEFSALNNPKAALTVCVYGQAALYDLCKMLDEKGYQVMNINTDGVGFTDQYGIGDEAWKDCQKIWEEKWKLYLELDEFDLWIQKDVNNYIALQDDHVKVKGGDLNKYAEPKYFSNNNARIVHIAVAENLLYNKPVYKTIKDNLDKPELFQYILQAGSTYLGTCDENGILLSQKVNRVFPVNDKVKGCKLYKLRPDGGRVLFPDMSDNLKLWNDDISKYKDFKKEIDLTFYAELANKKLESWKE